MHKSLKINNVKLLKYKTKYYVKCLLSNLKRMYFYINFNLGINQNISFTMTKIMFDYTKSVLERVSFDPKLFCKELEKAIKMLLPYEMEQLREWLISFTLEKPELRQYLLIVNS